MATGAAAGFEVGKYTAVSATPGFCGITAKLVVSPVQKWLIKLLATIAEKQQPSKVEGSLPLT